MCMYVFVRLMSFILMIFFILAMISFKGFILLIMLTFL